MKNVIVYGAGEFGSLVSNVVSYIDELNIVAYGDDSLNKSNEKIDDIPIYNMDKLMSFASDNNIRSAICAIGDNYVRSEKYNYLNNLGFEMISIVHPKSLIDSKVNFGKNVIIEMGTAIHTCSNIGNNVFLGGDALIGHHNIIGNNVLIGGNVSFGGSVVVEDFVSVGVGASIKPGITIGKGAVIGVGAAVIKNVEPNTTVVGVPAKPLKS